MIFKLQIVCFLFISLFPCFMVYSHAIIEDNYDFVGVPFAEWAEMVIDNAIRADSFSPNHLQFSDNLLHPLHSIKWILDQHLKSQTEITSKSIITHMETLWQSASTSSFSSDILTQDIKIMDDESLEMMSDYLNHILHIVLTKPRREKGLNVLVIGAGPVGLMNALQARSLGHHVSIREKRSDYSRNMWFDMGPSTWFPTLDWIELAGLYQQQIEIFHQNALAKEDDFDDYNADSNGNLAIETIRCQVLERFLAKTCFLSGVDMAYNSTYIRMEHAIPSSTSLKFNFQYMAVFNHGDSEIEKVQNFDFLIVADGRNSKARDDLGLKYILQEKFYVDGRIPMKIEGLVQPTLLVNLKTTEDGSCPMEKQSTDSYETGMVIPGITHVFKRFYFGRCHLQVLFTFEKWRELIPDRGSNIENHSIDNLLEVLLKIIKFNFAESYWKGIESGNQLKERIEIKNQTGTLEIESFEISICKVNQPITFLKDSNRQLAFIVGDAAITAHYRIGVGINNGNRQTRTTSSLLNTLDRYWNLPTDNEHNMNSNENQLKDEIQQIAEEENNELTKMAIFQSYLIAAESYCDYVVFVHPDVPQMFHHSTHIRRRDRYNGSKLKSHTFKLEGGDLLANCYYFS